MLILPPYLRKVHGRRLLTNIYNDLRKDPSVKDIIGIINYLKIKRKENVNANFS
jgi:hypothetical protein